MDQWIVAFGDPFDGLELVGPFASGEEAQAYAEIVDDARDWHVVKLNACDESILGMIEA